MDIDNMQAIWRKQQVILDQQKSIKERLLRESIAKSSKWLAPNKIAIPILTFCCLFCIFAIIEGAYSLMDVFPILLMSLFGYLQMWWQTTLLRKIASMEGGLIGMESNLIKYRIYYMRAKKITACIAVIYIAWFTWFLHHLGWDTRGIIFIISTTIAAGLLAFWIRNKKTKKALEEIEADMRELQEFSK